jgi:hypothetical protein
MRVSSIASGQKSIKQAHLDAFVGLQYTRHHADEGSLAGAVFTEEHHDFRVAEGSRRDGHFEVAQLLGHGGVFVVVHLLHDFLHGLGHLPVTPLV